MQKYAKWSMSKRKDVTSYCQNVSKVTNCKISESK